MKGPIILTCIYKCYYSRTFIRILLNYLYRQIVFILTDSVFETLKQDASYDIRSLIGQSNTLIDKLIYNFFHSPDYCIEGYNILKLDPIIRINLTNIFSTYKHPKFVYGFLFSKTKIISMVTKKGIPNLNVADVLLLFSLIQGSSFIDSSELWQPLCLSTLDSSGFINAYVSSLNNDVYLIYICLDNTPEMFKICKDLKQQFVNYLNTTTILPLISNSIYVDSYSISDIDPVCGRNIYYFIYRNAQGQVTKPVYEGIYSKESEKMRLYRLYMKAFDNMCNTHALEYLETTKSEIIYCVISSSYEVFISFFKIQF